MNIYGFWPDASDDADRIAFVRGLAADMESFATGGQDVNVMAAERGSDPGVQALAAYGPVKRPRLTALKRECDPDIVFRLNHNIPPD